MDMMILAAAVAGVMGTAFLSWGIYQVKTGKMVAKNRAYAVDEPREVGVIFTYLGALGVVLAVNLLCHSALLELPSVVVRVVEWVCFGTGMVGPLGLIVAGVYDLIKKRVFSIKTTPKTRGKIQKYYCAIGVTSMITGASALVGSMPLFLNLSAVRVASDIFWWIMIVALFIMCILMCKIELMAKPRK